MCIFNTFKCGIFSKNQNSGPPEWPKLQSQIPSNCQIWFYKKYKCHKVRLQISLLRTVISNIAKFEYYKILPLIFRQEYTRFLQRYKMLCDRTWPNYRGSEQDGVKLILQKFDLSKDVTFGNTKLVILPFSLFLKNQF